MIVFHADLDNTLIYSYKHDIGERKVCVELYQGREISFMGTDSYALLQQIRKKVCFVPTTTRTVEQYERIHLGEDIPEYALCCNGGILLEQGVRNEAWYAASRNLVQGSQQELEQAEELLNSDCYRCFEVRNIEQLFLFTKSDNPGETLARLQTKMSGETVEFFQNGSKVYVVPKVLNKGMAVRRFREWMQADYVIAAGDSLFDIPMLNEADEAYSPGEEKEGQLFSDRILAGIAGGV